MPELSRFQKGFAAAVARPAPRSERTPGPLQIYRNTALLGAVVDFVRATGPGVRGELWRRDDAAPAYRELCQYITNSSLSMRRRLRRPLARFSFAPLFRNGR